MHLYTEAKSIAEEALEECEGDEERAREFIYESCAGHRAAIYYHEGIKFCADQDTDKGEDWLDQCGGIAHPGDTFGAIACRIAYATLYVASCACLDELLEQQEEQHA